MELDSYGDRFVVWLFAGELALVAAVVAVSVVRSRGRVGRELAVERAGRLPRWLLLAAVVVSGTLVALSDVGELAAPLWTTLIACALVAVLEPSERDACYGERGVRRGWDALAFDELEEWRLTGEHLRWRRRGEWVACRVPVALHAELRAKLDKLCPGRESVFKS